MNMSLTFFEDPGHGWLRVPLELVRQLGIEITPYSYQDRRFAYLEEDVDYGVFLDAAKRAGLKVSIETIYQEETFIRSLPAFNG
jgi:hypothetical protein